MLFFIFYEVFLKSSWTAFKIIFPIFGFLAHLSRQAHKVSLKYTLTLASVVVVVVVVVNNV